MTTAVAERFTPEVSSGFAYFGQNQHVSLRPC